MPAPSFAVFLPPATLDDFPYHPSGSDWAQTWTTTSVWLVPPTAATHVPSTGGDGGEDPEEQHASPGSFGRHRDGAANAHSYGTSNSLRSLERSVYASASATSADRASSTSVARSREDIIPALNGPLSAAIEPLRRSLGPRRVRIRSSPVLVVETPERPNTSHKRLRFDAATKRPSRLSIQTNHLRDSNAQVEEREEEEDDDHDDDDDDDGDDDDKEEDFADKSRVVLGADGVQEEHDDDDVLESQLDIWQTLAHVRPGTDRAEDTTIDESRRTPAGALDNSTSWSRRAPRDGSTVCRFSFFSSRVTPRAKPPLQPNQSLARSHAANAVAAEASFDALAKLRGRLDLSDGRLSALAPHPLLTTERSISTETSTRRAVAPATVKRHPALDRLRRPGGRSDVGQCTTTTTATKSSRNETLKWVEEVESRDGSRRSSYGSDGITYSSELDSIPPPPTLHFALAAITPLSRILAQPHAYLQGNFQMGYGARNMAAAAAASGKVNLLVVVKEVGEISLVNAKYPTDLARRPGPTGQGEHLGPSTGKTERVELVVMDGKPDGAQDGPQQGEKHFFKVVLWGSLAKDWVGGEGEDVPWIGYGDASTSRDRRRSSYNKSRDLSKSTDDTRSRSLNNDTAAQFEESGSRLQESYGEPVRSTDPKPLREGDVIHLQSLSIVNSTTGFGGGGGTSAVGASAASASSAASLGAGLRRNRLGSGFPRRAAVVNPSAAPALCLVAHGSERSSTSIELCYRSKVLDLREDACGNFDPELARFDLRSRRVWDLHLLWMQSQEDMSHER
ncbi:hypothetical protein ACQY0O_000930 [Thecaphora frezii]